MKVARRVRWGESGNLRIAGGIAVRRPEGKQGARLLPNSMKTSRRRLRDLIEMAFSKRESVGWLARSGSTGERSAMSLKTGSARRVSWSFGSS